MLNTKKAIVIMCDCVCVCMLSYCFHVHQITAVVVEKITYDTSEWNIVKLTKFQKLNSIQVFKNSLHIRRKKEDLVD